MFRRRQFTRAVSDKRKRKHNCVKLVVFVMETIYQTRLFRDLNNLLIVSVKLTTITISMY